MLPAAKRARYLAEYGLPDHDAGLLVGDAKLTLDMLIDETKAELGEAGRAADSALAEEIAAGKAAWLAEWAPLLNSDEAPINPYRVINEINKFIDHDNAVVTPTSVPIPTFRSITA